MILKGPVANDNGGSIPANSIAQLTFDLTDPIWISLTGRLNFGSSLRDNVCVISKPTVQAGLGIVGVKIASSDLVTVIFANVTLSPITPTPNEIYQLAVFI